HEAVVENREVKPEDLLRGRVRRTARLHGAFFTGCPATTQKAPTDSHPRRPDEREDEAGRELRVEVGRLLGHQLARQAHRAGGGGREARSRSRPRDVAPPAAAPPRMSRGDARRGAPAAGPAPDGAWGGSPPPPPPCWPGRRGRIPRPRSRAARRGTGARSRSGDGRRR